MWRAAIEAEAGGCQNGRMVIVSGKVVDGRVEVDSELPGGASVTVLARARATQRPSAYCAMPWPGASAVRPSRSRSSLASFAIARERAAHRRSQRAHRVESARGGDLVAGEPTQGARGHSRGA